MCNKLLTPTHGRECETRKATNNNFIILPKPIYTAYLHQHKLGCIVKSHKCNTAFKKTKYIQNKQCIFAAVTTDNITTCNIHSVQQTEVASWNVKMSTERTTRYCRLEALDEGEMSMVLEGTTDGPGMATDGAGMSIVLKGTADSADMSIVLYGETDGADMAAISILLDGTAGGAGIAAISILLDGTAAGADMAAISILLDGTAGGAGIAPISIRLYGTSDGLGVAVICIPWTRL